MSVDYNLFKVAELKELLNERGLPIIGKKSELVERLLQSDGIDFTDGYSVSEIPQSINDKNDSDVYTSQNILLGEGIEEMYSSGCGVENAFVSHIDNSMSYSNNEICCSIESQNENEEKNNECSSGRDLSHFARGSENNSVVSKANITNPSNFLELTEDQKRQLRKQKFGILTDEEKKLERAKRFGLTSPQLEEEKKRIRAERFGILKGANNIEINSKLTDMEKEEERRKQRARRFGINNEEDKLKKRAERFGLLSEEEKKKRRLERFGCTT